MSTEYELSQPLTQTLNRLLLFDEFEPLTTIGRLTFKTALKLTYDRNEELVPCKGWRAELKKVSPLFRLYADADYILVVDAYTVQNSASNVVEAYMHKALMALSVSLSNSGKVKIARRPPDVAEFNRTVTRYGRWNQELEAFQLLLARAGQQAADEVTRLVSAREET